MTEVRYAQCVSRFVILFAALFLAFAPQASAQGSRSTAYLRLIDDVPLPPGYREAGEAVVFDSAEGRIVQISAVGRGASTASRQFYLDALPALGWSVVPEADGALSFNRGRERLSIGFSELLAPAPNASAIQFRLVARTASQSPD